MSLSDLASLGSFVSGIAVLVSLIFLYFQLRQVNQQVRQAEKNQRAALNQGIITRAADNIRWLAESPTNELMTKVIAGDTAFTAAELRRLRLAFRLIVNSAQDAYLQHKSGLIDTITLDNAMRALKSGWLTQSAYRAMWETEASSVAPEFRAVIDAMIRELPIAKPVDAVAQFNANLAKIAG